MIEIRELTKRYGANAAVDNLALKIEKGKIYGFLGPNGAGKSTTMNIITGYLASSSGTVEINGIDILDRPEEAKKQIGYLPEIPPLYADMTVDEYLAFVAEIKKIPKDERKSAVEDIKKKLKLEDVSKRLIKNLSKGYCQRVGVAQALMGYPPIIILDEPTAGLDPSQIIEFRNLIKSLGKKHTIIISSHIMQEISAVCDHVFIISHGKLVASDSPQNLEKQSTSEYSLKVGIKGERRAVEQAFKSLPEVEYNFSAVRKDEDAEKGVVYISVNQSDEKDVREDIFYLCAEKKLPIVMMESRKSSLEEVFIKLVNDGSDTADKEQEKDCGDDEDCSSSSKPEESCESDDDEREEDAK